jgi:hypothetical protein
MTGYVTTQPTNITIREPMDTELICVKEVYEERNQRPCINQSKRHQLGVVNKLMRILVQVGCQAGNSGFG